MRVSSAVLVVLVAAAAWSCGGDGTTAPSGAAVGVPVANEGWVHVAEGSVVAYRNNPPASGSHYPVWARYQAYTTPLARPYWVHNLEHGAIVLLYRPDVPAATLTALQDVYRTLPADSRCGYPRALLTPDPLMPRPIAAVAADWLLESDTVDAQAIRDFAAAHVGRGPEDICESGPRP